MLCSGAAEGIFGWGCKHFPRAPRQQGPPEARAPTPFFIMQFSPILVHFLSCNRVQHISHPLGTVQTQLKSMAKLTPLYPAVLPSEVIKGHGIIY